MVWSSLEPTVVVDQGKVLGPAVEVPLTLLGTPPTLRWPGTGVLRLHGGHDPLVAAQPGPVQADLRPLADGLPAAQREAEVSSGRHRFLCSLFFLKKNIKKHTCRYFSTGFWAGVTGGSALQTWCHFLSRQGQEAKHCLQTCVWFIHSTTPTQKFWQQWRHCNWRAVMRFLECFFQLNLLKCVWNENSEKIFLLRESDTGLWANPTLCNHRILINHRIYRVLLYMSRAHICQITESA